MIVCADIGLKRIGLAFCFDDKTVLPMDAIIRKNRDQAAGELDTVLALKEAKVLVVGLPMGGDAQDEMGRRIRHFISLIKFDCAVVYENEYSSSKEALEMHGGGLTKSKDGRLDSLAAKVILERYLRRKQQE
jgi:putative holliday junction resolvase